MNKNYISTLLLSAGLITASHAQQLNVNFTKTNLHNGKQRVTVFLQNGGATITGNTWNSLNPLSIRLPKGIGANPATATAADVTNVVTNIAGGSLQWTDAVLNAGGAVLPFTKDQVTGVPADDDGYIYLIGSVAGGTNAPALAAGSNTQIWTFDVPEAWACAACVQMITPAMAATDVVFNTVGLDVGSVLKNAGVGGGGTNLLSSPVNGPLPVKLVTFTATKADESRAQINWQTATEEGTDYFDVERAIDGKSFNTVVRHTIAAGNSATATDYQTYDNDPVAGTNYYRLKMVDVAGRITYSEIRTVNFGKVRNYSLSPNPATDVINIKGMDAGASIMIMNTTGQVISETKATGTTQAINLNKIVPGLYYVQIVQDEVIVYNQKFVKQ